MNYTQSLDWLFSQLPLYQRQGKSAYKADLTNIKKLVQELQHPEKEFKSIHVAGTNGKGSVSHMLASIFQEAGYKTGLYTSPHLKYFRERIRINGKMIPKREVLNFITKHKAFFENEGLSFFEMTVGLAFEYFSKENVDIAIIEVGLGGRLDSTNIITPELSIITNIGLDHTKILGDTLPKIAGEKAGIIKRGIPVVIGEKQTETTPVFIEKAQREKAPIYFAEELKLPEVESDLKGNYQTHNKRTVLAALQVLQKRNREISETTIHEGLMKVKRNTGLQGRWQILAEHPLIICDTAHNAEGLTYVTNQLKQLPKEKLHIVLGVVKDKNLERTLPLFPKHAKYYFCKAQIPRGLPVQILAQEAEKYGLKGEVFSSVQDAFKAAKRNAQKEDLIFIGGSTFTVAEIL